MMSAVPASIFPSQANSPLALPAGSVPREPLRQVLQRLEGPVSRQAAGPISSCIFALLTVGLGPLWTWARRWRRAAAMDQRDLSAIADVWRSRATEAQAIRLDKAVSRLGDGLLLDVASLVAVVVGGVGILAWLLIGNLNLPQMYALLSGRGSFTFWINGLSDEFNLGRLWMAVLLVAYACHFVEMKSHAAAVKGYLAVINGIGEQLGPKLRYSFRETGFLWVAAAVALCCGHCWWGIPMVLAGARQRTYLRQVRPVMRRQLAERTRLLAAGLPAGGILARQCRTAGCGIELPAGANFCPRCGHPTPLG